MDGHYANITCCPGRAAVLVFALYGPESGVGNLKRSSAFFQVNRSHSSSVKNSLSFSSIISSFPRSSNG